MRSKLPFILGLLVVAPALAASQWPESRGPNRDGSSAERNLPARWSPAGENLAWTLPIGGRSAPVVHGNRLYLQTTTSGDVSTTQERLVAIDTAAGRIVWERKVSQYLSDVPQHRAAWASPAVDTATGNIFMFTISAELLAFSPAGDILWKRSLPEEYGAITTHGGRTTSPIVDGDKVILNTLLQGWGSDLGRPGNRYFAFDKATGQTIWISSPQPRHYDTNYSSPILATIGGVRQMIVGGTDGAFHGLQVSTGKPIWRLEVSKRAILGSALVRGTTLFVTHGEENMDTTQMGMVAAIDLAGRTGEIPVSALAWNTHGFMPTFSSPVLDGNRIYVLDNGAIVGAFDVATGKELWTRTLGTLQKGSPTLADGKLYVGTENGKFYILRPSATGVEVLDEDVLGTATEPEVILAAPVVAGGRVYVTSMEKLYAIGPKAPVATAAVPPRPVEPASTAAAAQVQVFPYESLLDPGQTQSFKVHLFDANGAFIREAAAADVQWTVDQLAGSVDGAGRYVAPAGGTAGFVKATIGGITGQARVRVVPPLPWSFDFEGMKTTPSWWISNLKASPRELEGNTALVRPRDDTVGRRTKFLMGKPDWSDYTVEVDVRGVEMRRQRGDVGIVNQRYILMLFGNNQKIELQPWQAANEMTVSVAKFDWPVNTWYRMKLRVQNRPDGTTLVQGKVWPAAGPEPAAWTIEKVDRIPHRAGAPGLYGDGISDVHFDNFKVYRNQ